MPAAWVRFLMISATDWAVRGELMAPVRVTRRKIGPVVSLAWSSQARRARTAQGRDAVRDLRLAATSRRD
ncbi:MAG: hypothetical protein QOI15_1800 [Pseudonocardiales bacterium]|jgi:hypothetical protein|nr:hypothetical protein [Pseudonocardiales bacterium]